LKNVKNSFKQLSFKELSINLDQKLDRDYSTHTPVDKMMEIVFEASRNAGMDTYSVLKEFQFTDEEIEDYLKRAKGKKLKSG
jgi:hypothetical protein